MQLVLIGDVHGDAERIRAALDDAEKDEDRTIVLLGDYVNLGPNSAGVLDVLCACRRRIGDRLVLLEGNHDRVFRQFLDGAPIAQFLAMGGATTVQSYIGQPRGEVSRTLRASVPREHVELLRTLEGKWVGEEVVALHQWPTQQMDIGSRFAVLGHYYQPSHKPYIGKNVAYLDTGCGSDPEGVLTCFRFPERDWHVF
jgi:serine/threonine protein phosphatase 1